MTVTNTTRIGVTRWSSGDDPFTREQLAADHAAIEAKVAGFRSGLIANRPTASAAYDGFLYLATNENTPNGALYYCNGSTWYALNAFDTAGSSTPGDTATEGTAKTLARSDHRHSLPAFGLTGDIAPVSADAAAGTSVKFARADHVHDIADNAVTAGKIAAGGVSAGTQIADGIIDSTHLAPNSVTLSAISTDQHFAPGIIMEFGGTVPPGGWVFCDGTSYSRVEQPALFAVIGFKYGAYVNNDNFNVPDFRNRAARGAYRFYYETAPGVFTLYTDLGFALGSDQAVLGTTHLPPHTHQIAGFGTRDLEPGGGPNPDEYNYIFGVGDGAVQIGTTDYEGDSSVTLDIKPKYLTCNFIIKL